MKVERTEVPAILITLSGEEIINMKDLLFEERKNIRNAQFQVGSSYETFIEKLCTQFESLE